MPLYQALTYIKKQVEDLLNTPNVETYLDSIGKDDVKEGVYVSLLYAEEEKTLKNNDYLQTYYEKENPNKVEGYRKVNPKLYLNLYILIASSCSPYEEALKHISCIIAGFRQKNVFGRFKKEDGTVSDDFGEGFELLDKLVFDIHTLSFDQHNSLWQTIGGKQYPCIVYKVREIAFAEPQTGPDMKPIQKVLGLIKPITPGRLPEGSDATITDAAQIEAEKAQKEQLVNDSFELIKGDRSVIVVNSKEVYDSVKAMLKSK